MRAQEAKTIGDAIKDEGIAPALRVVVGAVDRFDIVEFGVAEGRLDTAGDDANRRAYDLADVNLRHDTADGPESYREGGGNAWGGVDEGAVKVENDRGEGGRQAGDLSSGVWS